MTFVFMVLAICVTANGYVAGGQFAAYVTPMYWFRGREVEKDGEKPSFVAKSRQ